MKNLIVSLFVLSAGTVAHANAETTIDAKLSGALLGQAAVSRLLKPDLRAKVASILTGQTYNDRVSVMKSDCKLDDEKITRTCTFEIGVDDLSDDDNGWGSVYRLEIETEPDSDHMLSLKGSLIAG